MSIDVLIPNTLYLTATNRLAEDCIVHLCAKASQQVIAKPQIFSLKHWCQQQFLDHPDLHLNRNLLSSAAEHFLWRRLLSNDPDCQLLLQSQSTLLSCQRAFHNAQQYLIDFKHPSWQHTAETCLFQRLTQQVQKYYQQQHCLDSSTLVAYLSQNIAQHHLNVNKIIWLGFNRLTPVQQQLFTRFKQLGIECEQLTPSTNMKKAACMRISLSDATQELLTVARYAKRYALKAKPSRLGIIIPQLDQIRLEVIRTFTQVFEDCPHSLTHYVSLSGGDSLTAFPIVKAALNLLRISGLTNWPYQVFKRILLSPFIAGAEQEQCARATLEQHLSQRLHHQFVLNTLHPFTASCPSLQASLQRLYKLKINTQSLATIHEFVSLFQSILQAWGWPGERSLTSLEYQCVQRLQQALLEWAQCDANDTHLSYDQAIENLSAWLTTILFQAQQPSRHIQILSPLEAAGLSFEQLWLTSMDQQHYPALAKATPWIPLNLQRAVNLPHHSMQWEQDYAEMQFQQFHAHCKTLIVSHAKQHDNQTIAPSALIAALPESDLPLADYTAKAHTLYQNQSLEYFNDVMAPSLQAKEDLRGGTQILKDFAQCPFKGFAAHRLHAKALNTPKPHVTHAQRGQVIHRALECIWQCLCDHQGLCQQSNAQLYSLVQQSTLTGMQAYGLNIQWLGKQRFELEQQRFIDLLLAWLAFEKTRTPFKVLACEHWFQVNLSGLQLKVQMDRMDQVNDGSLLILDYKTGTPHLNQWFGERMEDPQLPIYFSFYRDQPLSGLAFAQIHQDQLCFKGIVPHTSTLPHANTWDEYKSGIKVEWQMQLQNLATQLQMGQARPDPLPGSCSKCHLASVCRIYEEESL